MGILEGKIALISGTGGGQGRAAALTFAREGATIIGCDVEPESSQQTVELVHQAGGQMTATAPVDLTNPDQAKRWIDDAAAQHNGIDILYNNAARAGFGPIPDFPIEDWDNTITGELNIVYYSTRYAWPHLLKRGHGVIINIASAAGMAGSADMPMAAHAAAKAGVIGLTRQTAVEGAPHNIRAVCISPGPIATPGTDRDVAGLQQIRQNIANRTLLKRWGKPEEIVELAAFLASDRASFITGTNIPVDGGMNAW